MSVSIITTTSLLLRVLARVRPRLEGRGLNLWCPPFFFVVLTNEVVILVMCVLLLSLALTRAPIVSGAGCCGVGTWSQGKTARVDIMRMRWMDHFQVLLTKPMDHTARQRGVDDLTISCPQLKKLKVQFTFNIQY